MSEPAATNNWSTATRADTDTPTVPGYEILDELGRGGMGVVYKAMQVSLKRLVAIKLLRDGALAGPRERARFQTEVEAAARLQHPNVVSIYEVGTHNGLPNFTMELVEGGSLDRQIRGQPQPAPQAAELIRTLAHAIQHAHDQHVIHRDLKPANILLQVVSGQWTVDSQKEDKKKEVSSLSTDHCPLTTRTPKVSDFGLAKRLDSDSTALTQDGAILGSPSYMAPEQAAGRVREIGPACDIYALGAILYELLTGRPPFVGDTWSRTVEQVLHDEPIPPTRCNADVPRELETICLKCLEKEPARRYTSARELADDLGRFLEGKPLTAVPLSDAERQARLAARDGFQLTGEIGRGPRSVVYRALSGPLKQPVALKVFAKGVCTREEWEARFKRGAEQGAVLSHPQVVLVRRTGWWDDAPYVAMDFVPHGSLATPLPGKRRPVRDVLRLVEQLTEIVGYLHRQGVVHGNLKPSNVLLATDGIPCVADFRPTGGLAHGFASVEESDATGLAALAPELLEKPNTEPHPHTDIYGLGIILYELLTGRPPIAEATAQETLEAVRSREPVAPSSFNPDVTPPLEKVCLRCLRKNPWERYVRAYDLLIRLRHFQDDPSGGSDPGRRALRPRK